MWNHFVSNLCWELYLGDGWADSYHNFLSHQMHKLVFFKSSTLHSIMPAFGLVVSINFLSSCSGRWAELHIVTVLDGRFSPIVHQSIHRSFLLGHFLMVFKFQFISFCSCILWGIWVGVHGYPLTNILNSCRISWPHALPEHTLRWFINHRSLKKVQYLMRVVWAFGKSHHWSNTNSEAYASSNVVQPKRPLSMASLMPTTAI